MSCGNSSYFPMSFYPSYDPSSMMRQNVTQPSGMPAAMSSGYPAPMSGFPATMPSGPTYPVPMGGIPQTQAGTMEESFIENILRINKGKIGTFYFTYQGNNKWNSMVYHGRVETAGRDHIIISDPSSGKRFLLMMANLDWVEFEEKINYPFPEINPDFQANLTTSD